MKAITPATDLYALFGNPVSHSLGPFLHNTWFAQLDIDAVYMAFCVDEVKQAADAMRALGIKGASITIPFKEKIMDCLDAVDAVAAGMGAVNTVVNRNGHLTGYNTDCDGAVIPLKKVCPIHEQTVCILGAGGAAKAVAAGIQREGGRIIIANRNEKNGQSLARRYEAEFIPLEQFAGHGVDIIVNTTSLGMTPNIDTTPLNKRVLNDEMTVMDIVYNPVETRLLGEARAAGCTTIDGLSMFLHQAACQFDYFTGKEPSLESMRNIIKEKMEKR